MKLKFSAVILQGGVPMDRRVAFSVAKTWLLWYNNSAYAEFKSDCAALSLPMRHIFMEEC